jgi:aspartate kinase
MTRSTLVMKFGGSVLLTPHSFLEIAQHVLSVRDHVKQLVIVVSAMRGVTDHLLRLSKEVSTSPPKRELDMLVSVGERVSCSLLAMALEKRGIECVSFTGSQAGIITTNEHGEAKIVSVKPHRLLPALEMGKVVIVAGFQGVSIDKEITTLGRGGSDLTAVALGVALQGDVEFYKEVPGIFRTATCHGKPIKQITHEQAIEVIKTTGGRVVHVRAVELAKKNSLPLRVRSLKEKQGTYIFTETRNNRQPNYEASETETLLNI